MEMDYALRTFGIDLSHQLFSDPDPCAIEIDETIEEDIYRRQQLDSEWRDSEAPYCDSNSPIALFPNPHDIIMGRSKAVAVSWPGNLMYHKVVQDHVHRYIEAQSGSSVRIDKTLIAFNVLQTLHNEKKSRFLSRNDTNWTVIDAEAKVKISQALRMLAKEIVTKRG